MKEKRTIKLSEHIIEIVSDSGEGAQKAGQTFAAASAMMGNGLWTIEVIPAEIQPPPHTTGAASGNRIRLSEKAVTNAGDFANVVVAFNEMALLSRIQAGSLADDVIVLIDDKWKSDEDPAIRKGYAKILGGIKEKGGTVIEVPIEAETLKVVADPQRGKNMFAVGLLAYLYQRDVDLLRKLIARTFRKKSEEVLNKNMALLERGYEYGEQHLDFRYEIASKPTDEPQVVMNGNTAIALAAPGRGRDRRDRGGARRLLRRPDGAHHHLRPRHGPEDGVPGAGRHDGDAPRDRRCPARRPQHGPPHEDRAGRSAPRALRNARRRAEDRDRAQHHRGVLSHHGHGAEAGRGVPHAGDRAL
jgi:Pyruvate/2-oxoacid:ferredoxin oxidoreductase gamma subunit